MIKKIALLGILIGILITGNILADEGSCGLYLTLMTATNPESINYQPVTATIDNSPQYKVTNSSGLAKFGWKNVSGIYYIETVIEGETYTTTVEKPYGEVVFYTWYIQIIEHEEE